MRLSKKTIAAIGGGIMAIALPAGLSTASANSIPTLGPLWTAAVAEQIPMNLPAPAPAPSSPGWVRPYSTDDGGVGAMGGASPAGKLSAGTSMCPTTARRPAAFRSPFRPGDLRAGAASAAPALFNQNKRRLAVAINLKCLALTGAVLLFASAALGEQRTDIHHDDGSTSTCLKCHRNFQPAYKWRFSPFYSEFSSGRRR